jgi:hypothetical protein
MLSYELGDPDRPRGHALVYFQDLHDPVRLLASYVVIPPITMDFAKYVPPMFAGQFDQFVAQGPTAFPLPPIPEPVEGLEFLRSLAHARNDDLISGGALDLQDVGRTMQLVGELAGEYTMAYTRYVSDLPRVDASADLEALASDLDADDILLDVMTETEKVGRLAKLTGTLRYAVEGRDDELQRETALAMRKVARRLPDHYQADELVTAALSTEPHAEKLVSLYVERCYCLAREELESVPSLDARIRAISPGGA